MECTGTNPANPPGPPPGTLVRSRSSTRPWTTWSSGPWQARSASTTATARAGHRPPPRPEWAYDWPTWSRCWPAGPGDDRGPPGGPQGHDKLVWGLYQSNETYVVARADLGPEYQGASAF